jgi:acid phosphatase
MRGKFIVATICFLIALALSGCGGGSSQISAGTPPPNAKVPHIGHVFLLVEENQDYASVIGSSSMPYLNSLAAKYGLATQYYADAHPSIPNYFMLTTGQVVTFDDTFTATVSDDNLVHELIAAGKTWKSYAQSLPAVGYAGGDAYPYLERHNPFSYFSDVRNSSAQLQNLVPFTQLATDLSPAGQLPNFGFIVPDAQHDAHDCPDGTQNCANDVKLSAADSWLQTNIAPLLASLAFQQDGLLVIVFDEGEKIDITHGGGQVPMILISPKAKTAYQSNAFFEHASTLRLLVEATGAAALPGASAVASDMNSFFP